MANSNPKNQWQKGQSGNSAGSKQMDPKIRELIQDTGNKSLERLADLIGIDEIFDRRDPETGKSVQGSWEPKQQIAILALGADRAYGRTETVSVTHTHSGTVGLQVKYSQALRDISDRLPERLAMGRTIDARAEEIEDVEIEPVEARSGAKYPQ